ncbi:16S rRNA (cytidine(1402)-2'-O)-methyltransferase [Corynebacterium mendelii]|uniref:Ribosomal RNA small subunit methyltransferase I n=2 Tax=Corynebacterium mendelii TaxID=2765362 RepID=A0A939E111_9CORY|nr:16S rRNA (cytidine(1402)-2'-O)-methyltransferase [Corynebacterium mendelii]MBN9644728.1 16S rRNA (cytidine(1402)-2'-O)-methyltransferase [Corynebacterium mendelii]
MARPDTTPESSIPEQTAGLSGNDPGHPGSPDPDSAAESTHGPLFPPAVLAACPLPERGVVLAGTPLGNIWDASPRLAAALARADVIAAEDTRRTRQLAERLHVEITARVVSHFEHNETSRAEELVEQAAHSLVLVVTDAGMPVVADPGFPIVKLAHSVGVPVTVIPGPSAATTALAACGIAAGAFTFAGFAPRKSGQRKTWLKNLDSDTAVTVLFDSPHRIGQTLADAAEVFGADRQAAVAREMTKIHEEIIRGSLGELADICADGLRGEITLVIAPGQAAEPDPGELIGEVRQLVAAGMKLKAACGQVAAMTGVKKNRLYAAVIEANN